MSHNYCTSLSHLVLSIVSITCFKKINSLESNNGLTMSGFVIIILHSLLGVWKWGNPLHGRAVDKPYKFVGFLKEMLAFPCIVGQLWFKLNGNAVVAYLHPLVSLIPFILRSRKMSRFGNKDTFMLMEIFSCCLVSFMTENYFGVACAIAYGLNHFLIQDEYLNMPSIDIYNYAFCFFTYFSYRALCG
ncbi:PREDICTED: uncharacterized protein LOC108556342 [Nicrophorus vespilloides]|uniref:Uncharacterized protein LOC108556342 n=1 Tax=Nicrophorus vespilloides TaxID=110193 RepID=A0ABM1M005_NICVS|nr:PREDICTED: uncharacterized protein LOC108556342 [Nicrophorus vespilloides]